MDGWMDVNGSFSVWNICSECVEFYYQELNSEKLENESDCNESVNENSVVVNQRRNQTSDVVWYGTSAQDLIWRSVILEYLLLFETLW